MKRFSAVLLAVALLAGCQSAPSGSADAVAADAPHEIQVLTDQTTVWECPKCGMDYDRSGQCEMCHVDLVETQIAYVCPADGDAVAHAGKCPRCNMNARIVRTAVAANTDAPAEGDPATADGQ